MPLPARPLATDTFVVDGAKVEYRSLSRDEVLRLPDMSEDTGKAEAFIIARATGVTEEDAQKWREETDVKTVQGLLDAIAVLSGLRTVEVAGK